jgi:hypothetical protein
MKSIWQRVKNVPHLYLRHSPAGGRAKVLWGRTGMPWRSPRPLLPALSGQAPLAADDGHVGAVRAGDRVPDPAGGLVYSCATPFACAANAPRRAISRTFSGLIVASPRRCLPFADGPSVAPFAAIVRPLLRE